MTARTRTLPDLPELTMGQRLRRRAQETPDKPALRQKDFGIWNEVSWAEYWRRSRNLATGLRSLGFPAGGHLAVISENRQEWVFAQMAAGAAGGVCVGVYPTSPWPEVAYVLSHSDSQIVVCEDQEQTDKVLEALDQLPALQHILVIDPKGLIGARAEGRYANPMIRTLESVEALGETEDPAPIEALVDAQALDDVALLIYTSGSTGRPKGAMITYGNLRAQAAALIERMGEDAHTTHLSYLPLCHVAEQIFTTMGPIYAGSLVNFGESLRTVQSDLRETAPTSFLGVPRIWEKLHAAIHIKILEAGGVRRALFERAIADCTPFASTKPRSLWTLRERAVFAVWDLVLFRALRDHIGLTRTTAAMTGAAPVSPAIVAFFRTIGVPLLEVYGQTETTGMATGQYPGEIIPMAVGPATANAEIRLSEAGEMLVRSPLVFKAYYKNPEATAETIVDGWLHTGDIAEMVGDQYRIVDRKKDIMITAGGKNLSPSEIENALKASPYLKEVIVVGEARKFVSALIQVDFDTIGKWAEENHIPYTNFRSLAENSRVRELIQREVDAANSTLAPVANVRRFHLLTKELDHDDNEVTATMKVRRANIYEKYSQEIAALYA